MENKIKKEDIIKCITALIVCGIIFGLIRCL